MTNQIESSFLTDTEIQATLSKANDTIAQLESTKDRMQKIAHEPLEVTTRRKLRVHTFSLQFISAVLVAVILVLGIFGIILFKFSDSIVFDSVTHEIQIRHMQSQMAKQQTEIRRLEQLLGIDPNNPDAPLRRPSRSSTQ